jgi:hypothetical protein
MVQYISTNGKTAKYAEELANISSTPPAALLF